MSLLTQIKSFFQQQPLSRVSFSSRFDHYPWPCGNLSTQHQYMNNVIVYRCVQLIARGMASIPWILYQDDHEIEKHSLLSLFRQPNIKQADAAFREELIVHLLLSGNAYILKTYDEKMQILELNILSSDQIKIIPGKSVLPLAYEYIIGDQKHIFDVHPITGESRILHMKFFNPHDMLYGLSPLHAAQKSIEQYHAVSEHNLSLLRQGGRPSGAFIVKPDPRGIGLSEEQRKALTEDVRNVYEGANNAGKILFLEGDFDWKEMGSSLKDLDFLEGKNLSALEIAQVFGVPPMLVGIPGDSTFSNYREARYHLWEDTILPLMDLVVDELNRGIVREYDCNLKLSYNEDAIPALAIRRESSWEKIAHVDFLTVNEKRQAVGYGKMENNEKN